MSVGGELRLAKLLVSVGASLEREEVLASAAAVIAELIPGVRAVYVGGAPTQAIVLEPSLPSVEPSLAEQLAQLTERAREGVSVSGPWVVVSLARGNERHGLGGLLLCPRDGDPQALADDPRVEALASTLGDALRRAERHADARSEGPLVWIRFDAPMGWEVVGFLAAVTGALAEAGIPIGAVCGFSRDHLFVHARHEADARKVLAGLFPERRV